MFDSDDLEILDPKFANFSGPVPLALAAPNLEAEIAYARAYAKTRLDGGQVKTVCLAFAGFSTRDVEAFAKRIGCPALNGVYDPRYDSIVLSDLEQTKGYEFDTLIIVNCCNGVLPSKMALPEEQFRDACKMYVAMTRARSELILSFSGAASPWLDAVKTTISTDDWSLVENVSEHLFVGIPEVLPEIDLNQQAGDLKALTGLQYIYTTNAMGLPVEAQEKLIELVDGKGARIAQTQTRTRWPSIETLAEDLFASKRYDQHIGPRVAEDLRKNFQWLKQD
jgi:hypothetical protein